MFLAALPQKYFCPRPRSGLKEKSPALHSVSEPRAVATGSGSLLEKGLQQTAEMNFALFLIRSLPLAVLTQPMNRWLISFVGFADF